MPVSAAGRPSTHWFNRRAMLLHLLVALAVPLCLVAGWWQATRAMSGNTLSYIYAIEWPAFAVLAVWGWWQLLHPLAEETSTAQKVSARDEAGATEETASTEEPGQKDRRNGRRPLAPRPVQWAEEDESAALRAYNAYLGELRAGGRPRRPKGARRG